MTIIFHVFDTESNRTEATFRTLAAACNLATKLEMQAWNVSGWGRYIVREA